MTWPALTLGTRSAEVGNWQRFLSSQGFYAKADEVFGPLTKQATIAMQARLGTSPSGTVDSRTRTLSELLGFVPFVQAKNCSRVAAPDRDVRHVVIHTMEAPEKPGTAESVARWFADEEAPAFPAPRASAHYCIDNERTIQCVREVDVAWGVPGKYTDGFYVNAATIHLEHAGFARQSAAEWLDAYSDALLRRSAKLAREICSRHGIPLVYVDAEGLRRGDLGLTGHVDLSRAFGGSHYDPGPYFPWSHYLSLVGAS